MPRIYLAGPMTGLPEFNYPALHAEAARLRQLGYHVENPAENNAPADTTWSGYVRLALAQLITCDSIAILPGWHNSEGACLEYHVASKLGMQVHTANPLPPHPPTTHPPSGQSPASPHIVARSTSVA